MEKKKSIGWVIVIVAVIISFIVSLRETLFNGQPLDRTNFIMTVIIAAAILLWRIMLPRTLLRSSRLERQGSYGSNGSFK